MDVPAEYRTRFGSPVPAVIGVALMTDSDNICREAVAYFGGFRFTSEGRAPSSGGGEEAARGSVK